MPQPGGPAIVGVIEQRKDGALLQQIELASDSQIAGQDGFRVEIAAHSATRIPTPVDIRRTMREALPGLRMVDSPFFVQNRYGPFGYAVGRRGTADLCLYGWQSVQSRATLFAKQGRIDVRLRLCRRGATEQQLLATMYGYTINAFMTGGQWDPYDPPPLDEAIGRQGSKIRPVGATGPVEVLPTSAAAPAPRQRSRRAAPPAAAAAPIELSPTGPTVPPPPGAAIIPPPDAAAVPSPVAVPAVIVPPPPPGP